MDEREGISSFYLNNNGVSGSGSGSGSYTGSGSQEGGLHFPIPGNKNPNMYLHDQTNMRFVGSMGGLSYQMEHNRSPDFSHGINTSGTDSLVKKKRGRPRKYNGDGSPMALAITPSSLVGASSGSVTESPKKVKGRPPGSGRKQRLADVGEWMSTSAGTAFTPHIIQVETGEDVAAKILSFAQRRPRALCIVSGNGSVSVVQLRQFASSNGTATYEGPFEILSLSGSYLLPETGALSNLTGGLSISICSPDCHVIGGAIGGRLIASSLVQVMACSFVYTGNNLRMTKNDTPSAGEKSPCVHHNDVGPATSQPVAWPSESQAERNSHTEIDLTCG